MVKLSENWNPASPTPIAASFLRESLTNKQPVAPNRIPQLISARYYDPGTGEFISTDPLEYVDGMSMFRGYFVPEVIDPTGMKSILYQEDNHWIKLRQDTSENWDPNVDPYEPFVLNPNFFDCNINIFMGHSNLAGQFGRYPAIDNWWEDMGIRGGTICTDYFGVVSCFNGVYNGGIPSDNRIPNWPVIVRYLNATETSGLVDRALERANLLAKKLCKQSKELNETGDYERSRRCGERNAFCNTVTVKITCDQDMRDLFDKGIGPPDPNNPNADRPVVIRPEDLPAKNPCDSHYRVDCLFGTTLNNPGNPYD